MWRLTGTSLIFFLTLAAFSCGGDNSTTPSSPSVGQPVTVEIFDFEFRPKSITVETGQTVRWIFRGSDQTHTTTDRNGAWDSGFVFTQQGATFERTFGAQEAGGTFNYSCRSHQGCCQMQGSVRVGASAPPPDDGY